MSKNDINKRKRSNSLNLKGNRIIIQQDDKDNILSKSIMIQERKEMILYKNLNNIDLSTYDFIFLGRQINKVTLQGFDSFITLLKNIKSTFNPSLFQNNFNIENITKEGKFSFKNNNITDLLLVNGKYKDNNDIDIDQSINSRYLKIKNIIFEKSYNFYGTKSFFKGKHCFEIEIIDISNRELYIGLINITFINSLKCNINMGKNNNILNENDHISFNTFKIKEPILIKKNKMIYNHYITYGDIIGCCFDLDNNLFHLFLNGEIISTEKLTIETGQNCSFVPLLSLGKGIEIFFNPGNILKYEKNYLNYGFVPLDEYKKNSYEFSNLKKVTDDYINILVNHGKSIIGYQSITYSDINQIYHIIFEFLGKFSFQESYIISKSLINKLFGHSTKKKYTNTDFEIFYTIIKFILNSSSKSQIIIKNIFLNIAESIHINLKKGNFNNITSLTNLFNLLIFLLSKKEILEILDLLPKTLNKVFNSIFVAFYLNIDEFKNNNLDYIIHSNIKNNLKDNYSFPKLAISNEDLEKAIFLNLIKLKNNYNLVSELFVKLISCIYQNGTENKSNTIYKKFKKFLEKEIVNFKTNEKYFLEIFKSIFIPAMISFNNEYQKKEKITLSIKSYLSKNVNAGERIGGEFDDIYENYSKQIPNFKDLLNYKITNSNNIFLLDFIYLFFVKVIYYIPFKLFENIICNCKSNINSFYEESKELKDKSLYGTYNKILEYINYKLYYFSMDDLNILVQFLYNISDFILNDLYPNKLIYFLPERILNKIKYIIKIMITISKICKLPKNNIIENHYYNEDIKKYIQDSISFNSNLKNLSEKCCSQYLSILIKLIEDEDIKKSSINIDCILNLKQYLYLDYLYEDKDLYTIFNFINKVHNKPEYKLCVLNFMYLFDNNMNKKESQYFNFGKRLTSILKKNTNFLRILIILLYDSINKNLSKLEEQLGEFKYEPKNMQNQNNQNNQNNQTNTDFRFTNNNNMILINNIYNNNRLYDNNLSRFNRALRISAHRGHRFVIIGIEEDNNRDDRDKLNLLSQSFMEMKKEFLKLNNFYKLNAEIKELYQTNTFEQKKLFSLLLTLYNIIFLPNNISKLENSNSNNNNNNSDNNDGENNSFNILESYSYLLKKVYIFYKIIMTNITNLNDKEILLNISKERNVLHLKEILQVFDKYDTYKDGQNHIVMKQFIDNLEKLVSEEETTKPNIEQKENNDSKKDNNLCPICSDSNIDSHLLPCNHAICRNCLYQFLFENKTCPFCRVEIKGIKEDPNFKI